MHYLEIPKLTGYTESDLAKWLYYLGHAGQEDAVMEVLLKSNTGLYEADERYRQFLANEEARIAYQARSIYLHDEASRLQEARTEGEAAGELKKAREIAKILKNKDIAIKLIVEATDCRNFASQTSDYKR